ncbi:exodeoxyribonuclease V subunit beta [Catenovulum sediminis]|uniref:RecBCD enzyme subunit RecB n=1 Tax=Catenovulum sediminis TaxID=1740262 RepID=A0ABV1RM60_9ALTE
MKQLQAHILPLSGTHLIEASAGTGKTFNITRIYLRLLLERNLSVQQILVMTFTKAATEELKGRIEKELRQAIDLWGTRGEKDPFYQALESTIESQTAINRLNAAILELDEASIFTIHGFCKRVLSQQAFDSGLALDVSMEADTSDILLQAVQDWYREVANQQANFALLQQQNWHTPELFMQSFSAALRSDAPLIASTQASINAGFETVLEAYLQQLFMDKQQVKENLLDNQAYLREVLIDSKKGAEFNKRQDEWLQIIAWLDQVHTIETPKAIGDFCNGNRYRGKSDIKEILLPLNDLRKSAQAKISALHEEKQKQLDAVEGNQLVVDAINNIRKRFKSYKLKQSLMDFDDLVSVLANLLNEEAKKPFTERALTQALNQQYPVALVDEFQDTDAHQYSILKNIYQLKDNALYMIGDPKQAIYGFRGGDIFTYLAAKQSVDQIWLMDTNWRSSSAMVTAYNRLFWGNALEQNSQDVFGYSIEYQQIKSTEHSAAAKKPLTDQANTRAAMNYLWLAEDDTEKSNKADRQNQIAIWCAQEIRRLLQQTQLGGDALQPADIAVLVRSSNEAQIVKQALLEYRLPSVYLSERSNVLKSDEAVSVLIVLEALLDCDNEALLIRALASELLNYSAQQLSRYQMVEYQEEWEEAIQFAYSLRQLWFKRGVLSLLLKLIKNYYQPTEQNHERGLTNMIHLAEILQKAAREHKHPQQLVKWLKEQIVLDVSQSEAELRLESDANLIQIITQHKSKGLEYPVVFIPFASHYTDPTKFGNKAKHYFNYHHLELAQSVHQIGIDEYAKSAVTQEALAESMRLLYVAVTRAEHRCYIGLMHFDNSQYSAVAKALQVENKTQWQDKINQIVNTSNGTAIALSANDEVEFDSSIVSLDIHDAQPEQAQPAEFSAQVEQNWRLHSFSGITRNAHSSVKQLERFDELDSDGLLQIEAVKQPDIQQSSLIRFSLKKGAAAGDLLHDILEHTDFSAPDWLLIIKDPIARFGALEDNQQAFLIEWLEEVLQTSLPDMYNTDNQASTDFCLADLGFEQTLREAEFYFPLQRAVLKQLMLCLAQHRETNDVPVLPQQQSLQGMMHGFIDLIFEHKGRFYIADYKSTHLGEDYFGYNQAALKLNNEAHYYDLQYLIYALALHRYLNKRLPNYNFSQHFGGVYYLYLRGMHPDNPDYLGVYYKKLEEDLVTKLDSIMQNNNEVG